MKPAWVARGRGLYKPADARPSPSSPMPLPPLAALNGPFSRPLMVQSGTHGPSLVVGAPPRSIFPHPAFGPPVITQWLSPYRAAGLLVEFIRSDHSRALGIVEGPFDSNQWSIITKGGDAILVSRDDLVFLFPSTSADHPGQVFRYAVEDIERIDRLIRDLVASYSGHVKIAWGSYVDKKVQHVTAEMVAQFLFGTTPQPHEVYVAHSLLMNDALYFEKRLLPDRAVMVAPTVAPFQHTQVVFACRPLEEVTRHEKEMKDVEYYKTQLPRFVERCRRKGKIRAPIAAETEAKATLQVEDFSWHPTQDRVFIERLQAYALSASDHEDSDRNERDERVYHDILAPLGYGSAPRCLPHPLSEAFDLLVKLSIWSPNQNLHLLKFPRSLDVPAADERRFQQLSIRYGVNPATFDKDFQNRRDLSKIQPIFAIDSRALISGDDLEVDDALAVETHPNGDATLYVHIADPSRIIVPGDALDKHARSRVSSIYIPERKCTMLPSAMFARHFSLLPSKTNYALSFIIRLNDQGFVLSSEITPSIVDKIRCLTYAQVDGLLSPSSPPPSPSLPRSAPTSPAISTMASSFSSLLVGDAEKRALQTLAKLAEKRRQWRVRQGAIVGGHPASEIEVSGANGDEIRLELFDSDSPSHSLVAEAMILVGQVAADFASKHSIPLPFRAQYRRHAEMVPPAPTPGGRDPLSHEEPSAEVELKSAEVQRLHEHLRHRTALLPAYFATEAQPHHGLGLPAYAQATSPIRRYSDLLVHYQIKAVLRGERPPFSKDALRQLMLELDQGQQEISRLQNLSQRYWLLRYLERQPAARRYSAFVLGANPRQRVNGTQLLLLELGCKINTTFPSPPALGDLLRVAVREIDAFEGEIRFDIDTSLPAHKTSTPSPAQ